MGHKLLDLTGSKFNQLTVLEKMPSVKYGVTYKRRWKCVCECGKTTEVDTGQLTSGKAKSCGCAHAKSSVENSAKTRHLIAKKDAAFNSVRSIYQYNAKKRNLHWEIDNEHARNLFSSNCYFCGLEPSNVYKNTYYKQQYNGIDRLNNSLGYTKENTVACCKICNHAKHTMDEQAFMSWLERVFNHQSSLKRAIQELDK